MISVKSILEYNDIDIDKEWNESRTKENSMHSIHAYPAKFPAFIASKAFDYAIEEGVQVEKVADIFCGCGTVALEARMHNLEFWGCDINPVATLIAKAKSNNYNIKIMQKHYMNIIELKKRFLIMKRQMKDLNIGLQKTVLRYWIKLNMLLIWR